MISGKFLTAVIENQTIAGVQKWSVRESSEKLDGQTAAHRGYSANEPGSVTAEINLELVQDLTTGEYLRIQNGTLITNLRLYRNGLADGQPAFYFPFANVFESENSGEVRGRFTTRCTAENYGPYTANNPGAG
jgi:hypothetical protein